MNDEIDIVHQNPIAFAESFNMQRTDGLFFELFKDVVGDSLIVARGSAGANDKVIGKGADPRKIEPDEVLRLLIDRRFDGFGELIFCVQSVVMVSL